MSRVYNILDPSLDLLSDLELVGKFREEISAVKGSLVTDLSGIRGFLVTVGDRVSSDAVRSGLDPNVVIVDLKEKRTNLQLNSDVMRGRIILHANNPPGRITREAWLATRASLDLAKIGIKTCLIVNGEEDLLGFPAVIFSPEGSKLIYGQPDLGAVVVEVTRGVKESALNLMRKAFRPL